MVACREQGFGPDNCVLTPSLILKTLGFLRPGARPGYWVSTLAILWLAVIAVQGLRGWPGCTVKVPLDESLIRPEPKGNGTWKAPVPPKYRSWLTDQRGVLLDNSVRVGRRSPSISGVVKESGGIFAVHHAFVRWRTADGSDPRKTGRSFSLEVPARVPDWAWVVGFGGLVWGWSARTRQTDGHAQEAAVRGILSGKVSLDRWGDVALATGVLVLALAVAWARLPEMVEGNDGVMMIKGLPYSDAACWYDMSVSLAEGRGLASAFDGQRPWYSVLVAMCHAVQGAVAVEHGLIVNALGMALGAAGLFVLGRLAGSRVLGLVAAGVLLFSASHRQSSAALLTEIAGLALTVWSLVLILTTLSQFRPEVKSRRWVLPLGLGLGGVFQALGNLACPYTLAAVPIYGLLLWHEGRKRAGGWWKLRAFIPGLCLAAGFVLVLGPWMARQHQVHGLATLSTQTAELLYGSTFPEGPMKPAQAAELQAHFNGQPYTAADKYRFYMRRFVETITRDPETWLEGLGKRTRQFFGYYNVTRPEPVAGAALMVLAVLWQRRQDPHRLAWLPAGAVVLAIAVCLILLPLKMTGPSPLMTLAGLAGAGAVWLGGLRVRRVTVWLLATLLGCALINALTGNIIANRCWIFCDWCLWLVVLLAVFVSHDRLGALLASLPSRWQARRAAAHPKIADPDKAADALPAPGMALAAPQVGAEPTPAGHGLTPFVCVLTSVLLLVQGGLGLLLLSRQGRRLPWAPALAEGEAARIKPWAERKFPTAVALSGYDFQLLWVRLGEGACYLTPGEEATRFSRAFRPLSWPRTLRLVRGTPPGPGHAAPGAMVRLPGDARNLPEDRPGLLVAWLSVDAKANLGHDEEIYEALAFLPGDAEGRVDETQAIIFPKIPIRPAGPPAGR